MNDYTPLNPKFDDLPHFQPVTSAMYPQHDGDMEELAELADLILCYPRPDVAKLQHRYIYYRTQDDLNIFPMQLLKNWDRAGQLLRRWKGRD